MSSNRSASCDAQAHHTSSLCPPCTTSTSVTQCLFSSCQTSSPVIASRRNSPRSSYIHRLQPQLLHDDAKSPSVRKHSPRCGTTPQCPANAQLQHKRSLGPRTQPVNRLTSATTTFPYRVNVVRPEPQNNLLLTTDFGTQLEVADAQYCTWKPTKAPTPKYDVYPAKTYFPTLPRASSFSNHALCIETRSQPTTESSYLTRRFPRLPPSTPYRSMASKKTQISHNTASRRWKSTCLSSSCEVIKQQLERRIQNRGKLLNVVAQQKRFLTYGVLELLNNLMTRFILDAEICILARQILLEENAEKHAALAALLPRYLLLTGGLTAAKRVKSTCRISGQLSDSIASKDKNFQECSGLLSPRSSASSFNFAGDHFLHQHTLPLTPRTPPADKSQHDSPTSAESELNASVLRNDSLHGNAQKLTPEKSKFYKGCQRFKRITAEHARTDSANQPTYYLTSNTAAKVKKRFSESYGSPRAGRCTSGQQKCAFLQQSNFRKYKPENTTTESDSDVTRTPMLLDNKDGVISRRPLCVPVLQNIETVGTSGWLSGHCTAGEFIPSDLRHQKAKKFTTTYNVD